MCSLEEIELWLDHDPVDVALRTGNRSLAERIDLLQRARTKLPSWYAVRASFQRLALEQSSSEAVAASRNYSGGGLAIDLTTGLGVDTFFLSRHYAKVVSVESDPGRFNDARNNFALLGAGNITCVNDTAESFIEGFRGHADLVFVDPARRDCDGCRIYDIRRTSPDIVSMLPRLKECSDEIVVKCSPMYDVLQLHRELGDGFSIEVVSLDGECKETVIHWKKPALNPSTGESLELTLVSGRGNVRRFGFCFVDIASTDNLPIGQAAYLADMDAAFVKSSTQGRYMSTFHPDARYSQAGSYLLLEDHIEGIPAKLYRIERILPMSRARRELGGHRYTILRKGFPLSMHKIQEKSGIKEGGADFAAFVMYGGAAFFLEIKPVREKEAMSPSEIP